MIELLDRLRTALSERYAVEREIGRGGMATVYLADDLKHHRQVGIKVLHPELSATVGTDRFLREIEIVAGLTHPHVLPLHDSGETDGLLFFVMPYVEGESLQRRLQRETQIPLDEALRLTREVADALDYAHRHGVIHRDIKPANILLEEGHAVVADFGVASAVTEAGGEQVTAAGLAMGTAAYMSPEQASGARELDGRTDIYALGCVLFEMLAGQPPLTGATPQATQARRLTEPLPPLHTVRSSVPEAVNRVMARALDPVAADRYSTAGEFASAIDSAATPVSEEPERPATDGRRRRSGSRAAGIAGALVIILVAAWQLLPRLAGPAGRPDSATDSDSRGSIAVLPFDNIGGSEEDAHFVDGVHNQILSHLNKIEGLRPISRTSVMQYRATEKSLPTIAEELGADAILEGSVQRAGGTVRINVQLIDAQTDEHLWAETYDRELTAASVLGIQSNIAQQIAIALHAELSPAVQARIEARPTENLEAYDLYLRADRELNEGGVTQAGVELLERAIDLDPDFAEAHGMLAGAYTQAFYVRGELDPEYCEKASDEIDRARELGPDLASVHESTAWFYYRCPQDYDRALAELAEALRLAPNNVYALEVKGAVLRRQGKIREAVETFERASELSPLYGDLHLHLATSYAMLRMPAAAIPRIERAISLAPTSTISYGIATELYLGQEGDPDKARETIRRWKRLGMASEEMTARELWLDLLEGRTDEVLEKALQLPADVIIPRFLLRPPLRTRFQFLAAAYRLRGDATRERAYLDSARVLLEDAAAESEASFLHSALGLVYADLGLRHDAIREGETAIRLLPLEKDAWGGAYRVEDLARILVTVGEHEAAIDRLEQLLSIPFDLTATNLKIDPTWDSLRTDQRFLALLGTDG